MCEEKPKGWGTDNLSDFVSKAQHNIYASFNNTEPKKAYELLSDVNDAFNLMSINLHYPSGQEYILPGMLFIRSHSNYLGALRMSLAGQLPESFMLMRGCLETSLYGLHMFVNPSDAEIWINRHDSVKSLAKVKSTFTIRNVLETLKTKDRSLEESIGKLYDTTIDFGGHPNERAILSMMEFKTRDNHDKLFMQNYLTHSTPVYFNCLKSNAEIGVGALLIFQLVFRERFDILGISEKLERFKEKITPLFITIRDTSKSPSFEYHEDITNEEGDQ
jgi:hypothetical protein